MTDRSPPRILVLTDLFPELSETFIVTEARALQTVGCELRIEASSRSSRPNPEGERGLQVAYLEDDSKGRRLLDLAWLAVRHPAGCMRDLASRLRWRREEDVRSLAALAPRARRLARSGERHIHVHFAGNAALDALRLSRLMAVPYSVTAHAYDIFKDPRNLREKLECAAFVTTGCRYNVDYLRGLVGAEHRERIHEVVMGVDAERFRRRTPHSDSTRVVGIGRLVEKKGFADLVEATALLAGDGQLESVTIVGEGPLYKELRERARSLGVDVNLVGARHPDEVRSLLEEAVLLTMPCVVASDGDRDSMPVVVKEALAMEIPVVATDEVGLPEVIRPEWGRLVPPRDPSALAAAIAELLALPREDRERMGQAGRRWIVEHCSAEREAEKLARLIASASK